MNGVGGLTDAVTTPVPRLVLMGGGVEDNQAATLFLEGARGGDIIILRASGSLYSYTNYFVFGLQPSLMPSSVNTILIADPGAGAKEAVLCRLRYSEAIWLAGGDQKDYLVRWPPELHAGLKGFLEDGGTIGGTSAGAVSLGEAAFDADEGSVTSAAALQDPLSSAVSLTYPSFAHPKLQDAVVDSHFTQRDREGRLLVFLARFLVEKGKTQVLGVGLDEGVALVLDDAGFRVFGPADGAAWVYRVTGPAGLAEGQALELEGILRVKLEPGAGGAWPLDFSAHDGVQLRVREGIPGPA